MNTPVSQITIIGGGLMGSGIAQVFASLGVRVMVHDLNAETCRTPQTIRENLLGLEQSESQIKAVLGRVTFHGELAESVRGSQIVFECITENLALKQKLFQQLDEICPPATILASNTSVISITDIARDVKNKDRVVGTHFWNPAFLIPLVEVIRTDSTSDRTCDATMSLLKWAGKRPVQVNKDVPGFLVNRLQHALWREAIYLVEQGIADAQTVDEGIRYGFGLRLPALGPLENADMIGTDLTLSIHEYLFPHLNNSTTPSPLLKKMVQEGNIGFKSGEGFMSWNEDKIKHSKAHLLRYLQRVTK